MQNKRSAARIHRKANTVRFMSDERLKMVGRRLGDLSDLPEALRKQIQATKLDELEEQIIGVLDSLFDGIANVDEIIVGLYRKYGYVTEDRRQLANKLYRMQKSELVFSVAGRKGVYQTRKATVSTSDGADMV